MEKIIIGSDHGGFEIKEMLIKQLEKKNLEVKDAGCYDANSVNYPDVAQKVAGAVSKGEVKRGILICGSGIGMSIAANRFEGVRASLCHDHYTAKITRLHNDSNILVLGARTTGPEIILEILETWLTTEFEGGRHLSRVELLDKIK